MDGHGIGDRLNQVCLAAAAGLRMAGVVVTVKASADGSEAIAAALNDASRATAALEFDLGEGPARDAFRLGRPILVPDLSAAGRDWVRYDATAMGAGWCAVFAFPLQVGAAKFGVLTMLDTHPRFLDRRAVGRCLALAALATEMLLQSATDTEDGEIDPHLKSSLDFRNEIYQAQGMVMAALETDLRAALALMRAHAFVTERDLNDVALDILAGRLHLSEEGPQA
jgi:hypothetical protein